MIARSVLTKVLEDIREWCLGHLDLEQVVA
jgi:hypothetical protein